MKRYLSMFLLIIVCFLLQTGIFPHLQLLYIMPNLLVVLTAASGFMYGRKFGMFTGFLCGMLSDCIYGDVIGINILIFVLIGYVNGMANKLYFKDDLSIPITAIALSDLMYGVLYFICFFLLRGRFSILRYFAGVMVPEAIYTVVTGIIIYKFMSWLEEKLYPPEEVPLKQENKLY